MRPICIYRNRKLTVDFIILVLPVLDSSDVQRCSVWENQAIGFLKQEHINIKLHSIKFFSLLENRVESITLVG